MSKKFYKVKPNKRKCGCGRRLDHHHTLCNKCWNLRQTIKLYNEAHK